MFLKLLQVQPPLPGDECEDVWVEADKVQNVDSPPEEAGLPGSPIILRSSLHQLPADQTRDYALRTLSVALSQLVAEQGSSLSLALGMADMIELSVTNDVPVHRHPSESSEATDYLWRFRLATRLGPTERTLWTPPPTPFAHKSLRPRSRAHAAHHIGQLPLWLTTRRFWSVFHWWDDRLQHTVQFSLPAKLRRTLLRRFRLETL